MSEHTYTLRCRQNGASIGVPFEWAKLIPDGTKFAFKVTDHGFAYEPVEGEPDGIPEWLERLRGEGPA